MGLEGLICCKVTKFVSLSVVTLVKRICTRLFSKSRPRIYSVAVEAKYLGEKEKNKEKSNSNPKREEIEKKQEEEVRNYEKKNLTTVPITCFMICVETKFPTLCI